MDAQLQARCALFKLENADLKAENSQLRSQLALQTTRTRNEKHKNSKLTKENAQVTAHAERQGQKYLKWKGVASTALRKAARAEESRKNPEKRVSVSADGTPRPVHRVQAAEGGKRMALDEVTTTTQGSFECRDMGGLKYRKNEIAFAMQSDVEEGIGSRANRNKREQSNAYRRAAEEGASVAVVQAPRPGCKFRRKAPGVAVAAYDRPSNATMDRLIRPVFRELMFEKARSLLLTVNTIVLTADGKSFGGRHACGVQLSLYFMEPGDRKDPFGNCPEIRSVVPVPLQLQMVCNKKVKDQVGRNGERRALQTPFHVLRALRLAGLEAVLREFAHQLCFTTDAAADNTGLGKKQETMDNFAGKNSLLESLTVSDRVGSDVDEDLRKHGLLDILHVIHHGNEAQVRKLTSSMYNLRKAERNQSELKAKAKKIKEAEAMASANSGFRQLQEGAAVRALGAASVGAPTGPPSLSSPLSTAMSPDAESTPGGLRPGDDGEQQLKEGEAVVADSAGASLLSRPISETLPDAESALGETLSLEGLIASAEQDVAAKKAKLAADAAELAAASQAAGSPTPAPRPPPAAASKETVQLKLSGPLMQVPETVLRVFHLYEEKHVQPLLQRLTLLRWWMRRWSWLSHVTRRARLRIEIKVLETEVLETEIEILRREVGSILLQRDPVQECNHKVRILRERKVKERIRTFRIKRLAAWAGDLDTDPQAPEPKDDERFRAALKDCERFRAASFFQDDFVPMFDLRNSKTWKFVFAWYLDRRVRDPAASKKVSMAQSPSRFLPLLEQQRDEKTGEIRYHGHGQQCQDHASHNIVDPCTRFFDHEALNRVIQTTRGLKNPNNEEELLAAIDHLLSEQPACRQIDEHTPYFKEVREGVQKQAADGLGWSLEEVRQQMGYTQERGAEKVETCAIVRWATTSKAADWQATWRIAYAFGLLRIGGIALEEKTEVDAAVSLFSYAGYQTEKFAGLMLEKKVLESFEFLTGSRTLLQLFLLRFLYRFLFKPLMLVTGDNLGCGDGMVGMDSVPRRMLRVLLRGLFVEGTWDRELAHGHRTHGAEYTALSKWTICFLNPSCGDRVRRMLGDGWDDPMHASILEGMVNAPSELVAAFRMLAHKQDPLMPQEAELIFKAAYPDLYADPKKDSSFCLRMTQMQFLAQQVIRDSAEQLAYCVRQNLEGVRAFLAGMMRTRWTVGTVSCKPDGQNLVQSEINYAHEMALADAVITLKLRDEMMHEIEGEIASLAKKTPAMQGKDPLTFLPAYIAEAFGEAGWKDTQRFLGISDEQKKEGEWGRHYNLLDSLHCIDSAGNVLSGGTGLPRVKVQIQNEPSVPPEFYLYPPEWIQRFYDQCIQKLHWGFYPWWLRKNAGLLPSFIFKWNRVSELPKPLQAFPSAYGPSVKASNFSVTAKRLEQHWSYPALMYDTRSQMNNKSLTHFFVSPAFRHSTPAALMSAALDYRLDVFGELAQFTGTVRTYNVDKELRSVMKEDAHRAIGDEARERGGWSNIRDCGEYRRPGHSSLDPNTKQGKRTLRKVNKLSGVILARRGKQPQPSAGVQKRAPRQTAGARRRQPSGPHANHLSKAQAVMKLRAASGGQRAPTGASRRKPRAASGGQNAPTGASCRKPRLRAGAPGSGADAGESDEDFVPPPDRNADKHADAAEPPRRSARCGKRNAASGCVGDGGESDSDPLRKPNAGADCDGADDGEAGEGGGGEGASYGESAGKDADSQGDINMPLRPGGEGGVWAGEGKADRDGAESQDDLDGPLDDAPLTAFKRPVGAGHVQQTIGGGKRGNEVGASGEGAGQRRCRRGTAGGSANRTSGDDNDDRVGSGRGGGQGAGGGGADGGGGAAHDGGDIEAGGVGADDGNDHCDSDDSDKPLFAPRPGTGGSGRQRGARANKRLAASRPPESESDDDDTKPPANLKLNPQQEEEEIPANKWDMNFAARCGNLEFYARRKGSNKPHKPVWLMKEKDTAVFSGTPLEVTITRRASPYLKKLLQLKKISGGAPDPNLVFTVRCNGGCSSGRNHYLMYHEYAGTLVVAVEQIRRPVEDKTGNVDEDTKWKETMVYRRVFDTRDAVCKAKGRGVSGKYMGEAYFRKLYQEETKTKIETFHEGDSTYTGDIRTLVGVVRWQQANHVDLPLDYFTEYKDTDLLLMGEPVNQNPRL